MAVRRGIFYRHLLYLDPEEDGFTPCSRTLGIFEYSIRKWQTSQFPNWEEIIEGEVIGKSHLDLTISGGFSVDLERFSYS